MQNYLPPAPVIMARGRSFGGHVGGLAGSGYREIKAPDLVGGRCRKASASGLMDGKREEIKASGFERRA